MRWAKLLKRVFEIDMEHCPNCGGELTIIAVVLEALVIEKILTHLGRAGTGTTSDPALSRALQAERPDAADRDRSGDQATRAAGVGCVRGFAGPTETAWRQGIARKLLSVLADKRAAIAWRALRMVC
jgi:hypothetical protein